MKAEQLEEKSAVAVAVEEPEVSAGELVDSKARLLVSASKPWRDAGHGEAAAAGISRKPGALGQFKGTDALRRENKMARDIMKELKLGPEAREAVHEALSEGAQVAGRKLTYQEGVAAVKAVLGLL